MSRSLREIGNLQTSHAEEMHDVSSLPLRARTDPARSPSRRVGLSSMLLLMIAAFGVGFGALFGVTFGALFAFALGIPPRNLQQTSTVEHDLTP